MNSEPVPGKIVGFVPPQVEITTLVNGCGELFTFLRLPEIDATSWRAELAIPFGVILSKVWGVNRT